jgi:hypothetical protein
LLGLQSADCVTPKAALQGKHSAGALGTYFMCSLISHPCFKLFFPAGNAFSPKIIDGNVSWLQFPSDISICTVFPPESYISPILSFFSFSSSKADNVKRKHYLHRIPLSTLPSTLLQETMGKPQTPALLLCSSCSCLCPPPLRHS